MLRQSYRVAVVCSSDLCFAVLCAKGRPSWWDDGRGVATGKFGGKAASPGVGCSWPLSGPVFLMAGAANERARPG